MIAEITENGKADRFIRIAEKRTQRVLESLRLLGQCSNKRIYEYSDEQVNKIFREIRYYVRETEQSFKGTKSKRTFRL